MSAVVLRYVVTRNHAHKFYATKQSCKC